MKISQIDWEIEEMKISQIDWEIEEDQTDDGNTNCF